MSQIRVKIIPLHNVRWKKVFKEIMVGFKQLNIYVVPGTVRSKRNVKNMSTRMN